MMNDEQLRRTVLNIIHTIAPEADLENLEPDKGFRDQFGFDSVDFLNFALALQEELKLCIPETDFPVLATLNGCVNHLRACLKDAASA